MASRKLKQMKMAQALKGTDSLLLTQDKYEMEYYPALQVVEIHVKATKESIIVPLTNTAYMVPDESEAPKTSRNTKKD